MVNQKMDGGPLDPCSGFHLIDDRNVLGCLALLQDAPDVDLFRRRVIDVTNLCRPMKQAIDDHGRPHFRDAGMFDITRHLFDEGIADPHDSMLESAAIRYSQKLPTDVPRWRIHLWRSEYRKTPINGFETLKSEPNRLVTPHSCMGRDSAACLLFLIHHGLADGLRALELVRAYGENPHENERTDDDLRDLDSFGSESLNMPNVRLLGSRSRLSTVVVSTFVSLLQELSLSTLRTSLHGAGSTERRLFAQSYSREVLRGASRRNQSSIPAIFLAIAGWTLLEYANHQGSPERQIRFLLPFNRLGRESKLQLGNHYTTTIFKHSAGETIASGDKQLSRLANTPLEGHVLKMGSFALLPRSMQQWLYQNWAARLHSLCSIIPGPRRPIRLGNAAAEHLIAIPPLLHGHAASFGFLTYAGRTTFSLVVDPRVASDVEALRTCWERSIDRAIL